MGSHKKKQLSEFDRLTKHLVEFLVRSGAEELPDDAYIHVDFDDGEAADLLRALAGELPPDRITSASQRAVRQWRALAGALSKHAPLSETLSQLDAVLCDDGSPDALAVLGLYALVRASTLHEAVVRRAIPHSRRGQKGAAGKHGKPDGTWEKQEQLRAIWASGKYLTRDLCADEEYEALGVSRDTARDWLKKTLDPDPWPAKEQANAKTGKPRTR